MVRVVSSAPRQVKGVSLQENHSQGGRRGVRFLSRRISSDWLLSGEKTRQILVFCELNPPHRTLLGHANAKTAFVARRDDSSHIGAHPGGVSGSRR